MELFHPKITLFSFLVTAAILTAGCKDNISAGESPEGVVLAIEPSHVDFGSINDGESKIEKVAVINKSRFPIAVDRIAASCGCTSAKVADEVISPGKRSTLSVELSPHGRRGPFGSTVSITWRGLKPNESASGEASATFQADGLYVADLTPNYIDFGKVSISEESPIKVVSVSRGTQDTGFVDVKASSQSTAISASTIKMSNDQWRIEIRLSTKGRPSGPLRESAVIHFQDASGNDVHRSSIPIRGEIEGLVSAKPKTIYFGVLPQGVEIAGTISLDVPSDKIAKVKSVQIEPDSGCLTLKSGSSKNIVEYILRTGKKSGNLSGRALVSFEDKSLGDVSVPFILQVKQ